VSSQPDRSAEVRQPPAIEEFLEQPTRRLDDWHWLFREDRPFPIRSHRGLLGGLLVRLKGLLRPLVKTPQNDLWERQRTFNLILLEHLMEERRRLDERMTRERETLDGRVTHLETVAAEGFRDLMRHSDALYGRLDRKVDRYRREAQGLLSQLGSALARSEALGAGASRTEESDSGPAEPLVRAWEELEYLGFEERHRGTEEEIALRIGEYLPRLRGSGPVLDLGCGRGEALAVLADADIEARGVDASAEMVARCRQQGLDAFEGDLMEALAAQEPQSLGAVVSFHVIEHLPTSLLSGLLRLAWRALRPGGLLLLETPNPLSLVVAARNFWLDPTHHRPVHPDYLVTAAGQAGFEPVERLDLRPFAPSQRLPELPLDGLSPEGARLADAVNRLRDRLDDLLFGFQDYAIVAEKPLSKDEG
jgi:SAM-dependent methyltransferase